MAHIEVQASVRTHPKFLKAGASASWLWLCGLGYCQEGLTDGFIPASALPYLGVQNPRPLTDKLVRVGLWEEVEGGWQVHDYLEHNRSAAHIHAIKSKRKAGGALGGRPIKEPSEKPSRLSTEVLREVNLPENPTHLNSSQLSDNSAPATPVPPRPLAPIHGNEHRNHAHCGRVCLHASQFQEFVRRRNHAGAADEIREWAMDIEREWCSVGPRATDEPGDPFDFWRARYAERWPAVAATVARPDTRPAWAQKARPLP